MIKYCYAMAFVVISSLSACGQATITLGKPYAVIDGEDKFYFTRDGEILTVKIRKNNVFLQKLNAGSLTFKSVKLYDDFPKDCVIDQVTDFNGHYYVFYSMYEDKMEKLYCREIDFKAGSFAGKGVPIISVDEKITGTLTRSGFARYGTEGKYDFFFSYDRSSMVIQYRVKPEKRNDNKSFDVIGMHVFSGELVQKWGAKVKMPYTEKKMDNLDYSVDAKGNVYIVARIFNDNTTDLKKRGEKDANYHLEIIKVAAGGLETSSTTVTVADKFVKTMWLYESAKGYMICAGFYMKEKDSDGVDGVTIFKLGAKGELYDQKSVEIPLAVLNQYVSDRTRNKNERKEGKDEAEFESLRLDRVVVREDESILLIGEQRFMLTHMSTFNGRTSYRYTFHTNNILVTKLTASGTLAWMQKLPKRQQSGRGYGNMSFRYFASAKNHYFLFLDNEKNMNLPTTQVPDQHIDGQGGFLISYKLNDATGETTKTSLLNTRDVKGMEVYQFAPYRIMATAPNTLVFEAYKKKKEDILVKIELDQ